MFGFLGGTGSEGMGLALRLGLTGESLMIGSRNVTRAEQATEELKLMGHISEVYSGSNEEVANIADVVFITVPFSAQCYLLESLKSSLENKIIVDTVVPLERSRGRFGIVRVGEGSASLQAQSILSGSRVVSAFQNISAKDMLDLNSSLEGDVVICADDKEAKELVMTLTERIPSLRAIDGGALENSKYVEGLTALMLNINSLYGVRSSVRINGV